MIRKKIKKIKNFFFLSGLRKALKKAGFEPCGDTGFWSYEVSDDVRYVVSEPDLFCGTFHVSEFTKEGEYDKDSTSYLGVVVLDKLLEIARTVTGEASLVGCDYGYYYYKEACRRKGWIFNDGFPPKIKKRV